MSTVVDRTHSRSSSSSMARKYKRKTLTSSHHHPTAPRLTSTDLDVMVHALAAAYHDTLREAIEEHGTSLDGWLDAYVSGGTSFARPSAAPTSPPTSPQQNKANAADVVPPLTLPPRRPPSAPATTSRRPQTARVVRPYTQDPSEDDHSNTKVPRPYSTIPTTARATTTTPSLYTNKHTTGSSESVIPLRPQTPRWKDFFQDGRYMSITQYLRDRKAMIVNHKTFM
eukprot:PhF_6_TR42364/c0_g1_i2/m.63914